jgi:outer membrane immunogenic protein
MTPAAKYLLMWRRGHTPHESKRYQAPALYIGDRAAWDAKKGGVMRRRKFVFLLLGLACVVGLSLAITDQATAYTILGGLFGGEGSGRTAINGLMLGLLVIAIMATLTMFSDFGFLANTPFGAFLNTIATILNPQYAMLDSNHALAYARPVYGASMPLKALAPAPARSWDGAYVGLHLGYGFGSNEWRDTFGDLAGVPGGKLGVGSEGFLGGIQLGYNWQRGPWVLGIEGEFSGAGLNGDVTVNLPPATGTFTSETNWIASITGRAGYAFTTGGRNNSLVYVKGGAAFADFSHKFVLNGALGPFVFPEQDKVATGYTIGGGLETMLGRSRWSMRAEYMYYDFGSDRYTFSHPVFGLARIDIDQQIHVSKIGLNYRFN